jgi:serine/threonine-protein kinase
MAWNPFKTRRPATGTDSIFQSTLLEERTRSQFDGLHAQQAASDESLHWPAASGVVGRYQLRTVLGQGGLGTVYGAWDPLLSRRVAVKTVNPHQTEHREAHDDQVLNEARAAARLSHPHIVTVFDAGVSEHGVYIAMEPLQGSDLRQMLREGWRPGPLEAASLIRRIAEALAYAHGKGVIHCDVKPANIFMVGKRLPKVLDFGIARIARRDGSSATSTSAGSPYYLSPEQLEHAAVDRRCDVYALGVMLFELLTGHPPYIGHSMSEIHAAVLEAPQPMAIDFNPKVPLGLSMIAGQAMARAPESRYASARHLVAALQDWRASEEAQSLQQQGTRHSRWPRWPWSAR